jgi:integrase
VTLGGRDVYLGKHGTEASHAEYRRLTAEWLAAGGRAPARSSDVTICELMVGYVKHADAYYVKDSRPTSEATPVRLALRELKRLYGHTPAAQFGPLALKAVRQAFIDSGLCRNEVNRRTGLVVRFFRWCVENELVPASVHHGLKAVSGLRKGRTDVRESEPVGPVPDAFVDAIRPHVAPQVWAMVEIQRLTGMRPGEVTTLRACDLDTSGAEWVYTPASHKTEHRGKRRTVYLGPRTQAVVRPWLTPELSAYLFSPRAAVAAQGVARRAARKTPMTPSQRARARKARPKRAPGDRYTPGSYRHAVSRACEKAGVPDWHPNQLRHTAATQLRREFGLDVARVILGHSSPAVTEVYAEVDREKARDVMGRTR